MSISSKFKSVITVVLAVAMVFCMSFGTFAATDTAAKDIPVKINLQEVDRISNPLVETDITTAPITVNAASTDTLYDVILASGLTTAADWHQVDILDPSTWLPTGEKGWAMDSLTYNNHSYANETIVSESNYYKGIAWSYFFGNTTPANQWDYPSNYMSQFTVADLAASGYEFTLSYELSEMSW